MLRTVVGALAILAASAAPALAECDINAESAAVVAAWGAKVRDGAMPAEQLEEISKTIQEVPTVATSEPARACELLQDLKAKLGLAS